VGIHGFNLALKGQQHENFSPFSLKIWAPHKEEKLEKQVKKQVKNK
jgi:hypothetical protein